MMVVKHKLPISSVLVLVSNLNYLSIKQIKKTNRSRPLHNIIKSCVFISGCIFTLFILLLFFLSALSISRYNQPID